MVRLTVVSPHRDDAVFSLSIALSRWSELEPPRIVNIFTISDYGPHAPATRISTISSLRSREDRKALSAIDTRITVKSLDWLDAPLRYGVSASTVCLPETISLQSDEELFRLTRELHPYLAGGFVLAPLALGNHVDHRLANKAAIGASKPAQLAFYEDLPYATWTSESCLRARVTEVEQLTRTRLRPSVIRSSACGVTRKLFIAAHYRSQITREEAAAIARYGLRYRTGERIWVPAYASNWRAFPV